MQSRQKALQIFVTLFSLDNNNIYIQCERNKSKFTIQHMRCGVICSAKSNLTYTYLTRRRMRRKHITIHQIYTQNFLSLFHNSLTHMHTYIHSYIHTLCARWARQFFVHHFFSGYNLYMDFVWSIYIYTLYIYSSEIQCNNNIYSLSRAHWFAHTLIQLSSTAIFTIGFWNQKS